VLSVATRAALPIQSLFSGGVLKQSDARTQALSREPLIVGFAGARVPDAKRQSISSNSYFGWLLGPTYSAEDPDALKLSQVTRSYGVSADVSFPGWWRYATLTVRTAWIKDWSTATAQNVFNDAAAQTSTRRVVVPATDSSFESLTSYIATKLHTRQYSRLFASAVTPNVVSACMNSNAATFQISGANIWRASSVFLGSTAATDVVVLPDMNGISAQFDMTKVFGELATSGNTLQVVPLSVSAPQGEALSLPVYILGNRQSANGATTCQSPITTATTYELLPPMVLMSSPSKVCAGAKSVPVTISGINLPVAIQTSTGWYPAGSMCRPKTSSMEDSVSTGGCIQSSEFVPATFYGSDNLQTGTLVPNGSLKAGRTIMLAGTGYDSNRHLRAVSFTLNVEDCESQSTKPKAPDSTPAPTAKPATAKLTTTTVKIAKDQTIAIVAPVPQAYAELKIGVRPKTLTNDAAWIYSGLLTPSPGDASDVKATWISAVSTASLVASWRSW